MKLLTLFALIALSVPYSFSQSSSSIIGRYYWKEAVTMERVHTLDGSGSGELVLSLRGQKFEVINEIGDTNAIIRILDYDQDQEEANDKRLIFNQGYYTNDEEKLVPAIKLNDTKEVDSDTSEVERKAIASKTRQVYFLVDIDLVRDFGVKYSYNGCSLAVGAINYPFKLRVQQNNFDFSGSFNIGAALGVKMPHYSYKKFEHTVLLGFSISNVKLDSVDVKKNHEKLIESNDFSSFSASIGYMLQYQKAQIGVFFGLDYLSSTNQKTYDWDYQGQPWISIGIGLNIFTQENDKGTGNKGNTL